MDGSTSTNVFSSYTYWAASSIATSVVIRQFIPQYSILHSYFWTATTLFFAQWLIYGIYTVIIYPRFVSPLRHLPEPTTGNSFFNGQFSTIIKDPSGTPARRWAKEIPNEGLIRYRGLLNGERLLITSPKGLTEVLSGKNYDFVKPELMRSGLGRLLGIGILFAEGDEHKIQRKNLMPAFHFRHIKKLYPIFWAKSVEMVNQIQVSVSSVASSSTPLSIEIGEWASRATLDIIGVAGMGQDFNSLSDPDTELNRVYRAIFQPSKAAQILGLLQFFIPNIILHNLPLKRNVEVQDARRVARNISAQLIQRKREKIAAKEELSPDIISVALESGGFSDEKLIDNMMTFLAAGHETTATAFTWAIYLLSQHADVQTTLRDEIRTHLPSPSPSDNNSFSSNAVDHEKIDNMPYLHAVCNEVLRAYPPVPLTMRDAAVDTSILGQFVPQGTRIVLVPWATNHSTELWGPDASEFKPSRWLAPGQANAGGADSNYAFLTFLHGPRSCIGSKFALAELACLMAAFVGRFEFSLTDPDEKIVIKGGVTARPEKGIRVDLNVVDGW